jgi:Tol biopolymer transport system component
MFVASGLVLSGSVFVPMVAGAVLGTPTTWLESVSTSDEQANLYSYAIGISAHGRYVVFNSDATNLVAGDTNKQGDVFVRDRLTGETTRVSVSSTGKQADQSSDPFGGSHAGGLSASGRYVVFVSDASNLVRRDTNGAGDIFVHDRLSAETRRVSVSSTSRQANGPSGSPVISAGGRYVAFSSSASNLVAGDTNRKSDVFVRDRRTRQTRRVSLSSAGRQANRRCEGPAISAHGRYVAFATNASSLVAGDTNGLADIFVRDLRTGQTRRVSVSSRGRQSTGSPTHTGSNAPTISADGRYVAFHSDASNLVPGDTNGTFDIFVRDRVTGKTRRVSVGNGGEEANAETLGPGLISADGHYVAFASLASNLVANDLNDITDVFIRDRRTRRTLLASLSSTGEQGNDGSWPAALSVDNRYLAFSSWAGNLVPDDASPGPDVFVRDFAEAPN